MTKILHKIIQLLSQLNEVLGRALAWLTTALVLLVCVDVARRYFFKATSVAFLELEWYIFSLIFLLGGGYSLRHDQHVRVDVFYQRFTPRTRATINFVGTLLFLIPFCLVLIYAGGRFAWYSYQLNESSPNPGGLPALYLIKAVIPLGFSLLLLQALVFLWESWRAMHTP